MIVTKSHLKKIIRECLYSEFLITELFSKSKEEETAFVKSKLQSKIWGSSSNLRDSIKDVVSDPGRGEVRITLPSSGRTATDREVACAIENFMKKLRGSLDLNWIVKPCRYDDTMKRKEILIVGI